MHRNVRDHGAYMVMVDDAGRRWSVQRHWHALHGPVPLSELKNLDFKEIE